MTATLRRFPLAAACALIAAILVLCAAPGRAYAHWAIPGTTGEGTESDPILVNTWPEFEAALEYHENFYIVVENTSGYMTKTSSSDALMSVEDGGAYITIPKGFSKDVEFEAQATYEGSKSGADLFGTFILNQGVLTLHAIDTKANLTVGSTYNGRVTAIRNEGELYVYGTISIKAACLDNYTKPQTIGIHCATDNSKLVISGYRDEDSSYASESYCKITGAAFDDLDTGIGAGVYVEKAAAVDIFGGRLEARRNAGATAIAHNGLVINTQAIDDVRMHGGVACGVTFVGDKASNYKATKLAGWGTYTGDHASEADLNNSDRYKSGSITIGGVVYPFYRTVNTSTYSTWLALQVRPINFNNDACESALSAVMEFTAGDGVTYSVVDEGGLPDWLSAVGYSSWDEQTVMTEAPVWPVLYRKSFDSTDYGTCSALPTKTIATGAFKEKNINSIELPAQLESIGASAFQSTFLTSIAIPSEVTEIKNQAFAYSMIQKVSISSFVLQEIGDKAFSTATLKEISCPCMLDMQIGEYAYGYRYVDGVYEMIDPFYVYAIPDSPFWKDAVKKGFIYDLRKASVQGISDQYYTGSAITPKPVVTVQNDLGTVTLKEGVDYELSYSKNTAVGTASVEITGIDPKGYGGAATEFKIKVATGAATWNRLAGAVALDTMSKIVDEGSFVKGGTVVLTTVDGYWDALTAAGIAGMANAPILMTDGKSLSAQTAAQIKKLAPKTIVVCGGPAAVQDAVASQAMNAAGTSPVVKRCSGDDAVGTAVDIFNQAPSITGGTWSTTAFVCTNDGYWDALAAAPIAYAKGMPIFLTSGSEQISDSVIEAMKAAGITNVWIVGGEAAITVNVPLKLDSNFIHVNGRLAGATAVETSEAVAAFGLEQGMTANWMGVATTNGYWDALAGAALCGKTNSVLVLVDNASSHSISGFVKSHASQIASGYIFGGTAAVPDSVATALKSASTYTTSALEKLQAAAADL